MKKIFSILLTICLLISLVPMVSFATEAPTPIFEETFETKPSDDATNSPWFRNSNYVSTNGTLLNQTIGYSDNYRAANYAEDPFTMTELGYMWTTDPVNSSNHVLNTGKYNMDKWIIGRDLNADENSDGTNDYANKIVEVKTYFDTDAIKEQGEFVLKVGEIKINVYGWQFVYATNKNDEIYNSKTGFSYKVQGNAQAAVEWSNKPGDVATDLHYLGTGIDIHATDGWHQFVFDYSQAATGTTKPVDVYLNGVKIISTTVDTAINGTLNRADGTYIAIGDGRDENGKEIRDYYIDDIRVWDTTALNHVLGLHTTPTVKNVTNKPIYEQNFDSGYSFNGWSSLFNKNTRWRMLADDKIKVIAVDKENAENNVANPDVNSYPLYSQLPVAEKNKTIEVWFYDDPEVWKSNSDGSKLINSGVYVGSNMVAANSFYFIGVQHDNAYNESREKNYCTLIPTDNSATQGTAIARTKGWHQFVYDFSGTNATTGKRQYTLYIDGTLVRQGDVESDIYCHDITIGDTVRKNSVGTSMYYDDIRVWNNIGEMHNGTKSLTIRDVDFTDSDGNDISALTAGATVKAKVKYVNKTLNQPANVIIAMYKDNEFISASVDTQKTLTQKWGQVNYLTTEASITLPSDLTGITLKAFLWNKLDELKPLTTLTELSAE